MDFLKAIEAERTRINARLDELHKQREAIDDETVKLDLELKAINAYQNAKEGKVVVKTTKPKQERGPRKTGLREKVKNVIQSSPAGISRAQIIELLEGKDNKSLQQAISNSLVLLKKKNEVTAEGGKYTVAKA